MGRMHVVGTAGHVDHGKSTLVRALTGIDPDRFEEEKRRGLTIDLGFAWRTLPSGREIGIVDVPGHERFIRNMLAGAGGIDVALFVVAADEGWMPQSAEHLQILDFLDVRCGVVALTKSDSAGDLVEIVSEEVRERLSGSTLSGATIVPVSAITGDGLDELLAALDEALPPDRVRDYDVTSPSAPVDLHAVRPDGLAGPLIGTVRDRESAAALGEFREEMRRSLELGRPRLFVDRSFTITGAGAVVSGTLTGGRLRVSDTVTILPSHTRARVRSLQTHGRVVEVATPPCRVAVNLVGVDRHSVQRGDVIVVDEWITTDRFAARLRAGKSLRHPLKERGAYELFVGSAQTRCRLKFLESDEPLTAGGATLAEVATDRPLPLVPGDRFVVRDAGRWETVAGGVVVDNDPPKLKRGDNTTLEALRAREGLTGVQLTTWLIDKYRVIEGRRLEMLADLGPREFSDAIDRAAEMYTSGYVFAHGAFGELERRMQDALARFHAEHPLAPVMPIGQLMQILGIERDALDDLIGEWQEAYSLVVDGNTVRLPQSGAALSTEQRATADKALRLLREKDATPAALSEVGLTIELAKALEKRGELVFIAADIAYPTDVWADIEQRIVELISNAGPVTVSQVRGTLATTRKYAVPLLEKLDATGVTRRKGDVRELGPRGRELLANRA